MVIVLVFLCVKYVVCVTCGATFPFQLLLIVTASDNVANDICRCLLENVIIRLQSSIELRYTHTHIHVHTHSRSTTIT